jgi:hypothetical protein
MSVALVNQSLKVSDFYCLTTAYALYDGVKLDRVIGQLCQ